MLMKNKQPTSFKNILEIIPDSGRDIQRLQTLLDTDNLPTITVVGKYNHGKSRLLNEIIGEDHFKTADKRETVALSSYIKDGMRWLDAPGLDADVSQQDDALATHAAWLEADIRLFVHSAKEGELDAKEMAAIQEFLDDSADSGRQLLFVLSQIDQVSEDDLTRVVEEIGRQIPLTKIHCTSSTRYRKGVDEGKPLLIQKSGFDEFRRHLEESLVATSKTRAAETSAIFLKLHTILTGIMKESATSASAFRRKQAAMRKKFTKGIEKILDGAQREMEKI